MRISRVDDGLACWIDFEHPFHLPSSDRQKMKQNRIAPGRSELSCLVSSLPPLLAPDPST
jgi:hypothetical protein